MAIEWDASKVWSFSVTSKVIQQNLTQNFTNLLWLAAPAATMLQDYKADMSALFTTDRWKVPKWYVLQWQVQNEFHENWVISVYNINAWI